MVKDFNPPQYGSEGFDCPHCLSFSQQDWYGVVNDFKHGGYELEDYLPKRYDDDNSINDFSIDNLLAISQCYKCKNVALWINGLIVFPTTILAPLPNPDMPEDVKSIYMEARSVSAISPRSATALLRLAIEKLLPQVGAKKAKIDSMIGELVGNGLPIEVERALDSLRVIGNEAVHPGTIDLDDIQDISLALFKLLNIVVDRMITERNKINEMYSLIPEEKIKGIDNRNMRYTTKK